MQQNAPDQFTDLPYKHGHNGGDTQTNDPAKKGRPGCQGPLTVVGANTNARLDGTAIVITPIGFEKSHEAACHPDEQDKYRDIG